MKTMNLLLSAIAFVTTLSIEAEEISIIPKPVMLEVSENYFTLNNTTSISCDKKLLPKAEQLSQLLKKATHLLTHLLIYLFSLCLRRSEQQMP